MCIPVRYIWGQKTNSYISLVILSLFFSSLKIIRSMSYLRSIKKVLNYYINIFVLLQITQTKCKILPLIPTNTTSTKRVVTCVVEGLHVTECPNVSQRQLILNQQYLKQIIMKNNEKRKKNLSNSNNTTIWLENHLVNKIYYISVGRRLDDYGHVLLRFMLPLGIRISAIEILKSYNNLTNMAGKPYTAAMTHNHLPAKPVVESYPLHCTLLDFLYIGCTVLHIIKPSHKILHKTAQNTPLPLHNL